jgi:hypothetical protein
MEFLLDQPIALTESELDVVAGGGGNIIYNIHVANNGNRDGNGNRNGIGIGNGNAIGHTNGNLDGNVAISIG